MSEAEAQALIGGWLYLHTTKAQPSEFGGLVLDVENAKREGAAREDGFAIIFEARKEGVGLRWRGADHGRAWTSGAVDLALTHEI